MYGIKYQRVGQVIMCCNTFSHPIRPRTQRGLKIVIHMKYEELVSNIFFSGDLQPGGPN